MKIYHLNLVGKVFDSLRLFNAQILLQLRMDAEERVTRTKESLDATRDQVARLSEVEHECKGQLDSMTEQYEYVQQQYEEYKVSYGVFES